MLTYGIASAAILRLIVIGLGTELVDNFQIVNLGFAAFLIFNAWQMVTAGGGEEEDLADKWIVKACRYCTLQCTLVAYRNGSLVCNSLLLLFPGSRTHPEMSARCPQTH